LKDSVRVRPATLEDEVGLRSHANGCDGQRAVGFLEGWFVARGARRLGGSIAAHRALGYEIDCRCVNFRKSL
jgi:hypothetical protein